MFLLIKILCYSAGLLASVDILAKYHPKTAKIKHPSAMLLEKSGELLVEIGSSLQKHFEKFNEIEGQSYVKKDDEEALKILRELRYQIGEEKFRYFIEEVIK